MTDSVALEAPAQRPSKTEKWQTVFALGITQIIAWGTTFYMPAVLARPIAEDTGWSFAWVTGGLSLALVVAGLTAPRLGRRIDSSGGKPVMSAGSVLIAAGLAMLGAAEHFALYFAAWTLLGFGMAGALYDAAFATLASRFGTDARAPITGVTLFGGLASTLCWPLLTTLEEVFGWRTTCFMLAGMHLMICLPLHLCILQGSGRRPLKTSCSSREPAARSGWRGLRADKRFWWVCVTFTGLAFVMTTFAVHLLDVLQDLGLGVGTALLVGVLFGPAQVIGRVIELSFCQNVHPLWMAMAGSVLVLVGVAGFAPGQPEIAILAALAYGVGNGIITIARGTLPLAIFGASNIGERMGCIAMPALIAQAIAPVASARVLEVTSSEALLFLCAGLLLMSMTALACLFLTRDSPRS